MTFEIIESANITLPLVEDELGRFKDSNYSSNHGLIVEIAAIHEGVSNNFIRYKKQALEDSMDTWIEPYLKPVLLNHDRMSDPMGRIIGTGMKREQDGTSYLSLQAAITSTDAIERIMDKRYLTGSVAGVPEEARCSICEVDWVGAIRANPAKAPCRHVRGHVYDGKVMEMVPYGIVWKEYSFVNMPGDLRSGIRDVHSTNTVGAVRELEDSKWTTGARYFVLSLNKEEVVECTESGSVDILWGMKKKGSAPLYHGLRGAFLEAQIINNIEEDSVKRYTDNTSLDGINNSEEIDYMSVEDTTALGEQEDILAVVKKLNDTSTVTPAELEESENTDDNDTNVSEEVDSSEDEPSDDNAVVGAGEGECPESQEGDGSEGIKPEASIEDTQTDEAEDIEGDIQEEESNSSVDDTDTELTEKESETTDESPVKEEDHALTALQAENAALQERVTKLTEALHRVLAERVVETKILKGLAESEQRETLLEEHISRSASSLADSLRDLSSIEVRSPDVSGAYEELSADNQPEVVEGEKNVTTIGGDSVELIEESVEDRWINTLSDVLLGRKSL